MTTDNKANINPVPNGPYIVKGIKRLSNRNGEMETSETMYLCRCGQSANKPFCDGTHKKVGFSSDKLEGRLPDRCDHYAGTAITIHDNRSVCAHAGVCTDNLASVFRMRQEPWIDADGASVEEIMAVIDRCPSGALSYTLSDGTSSQASAEAAIRIAPNGPYMVTDADLLDTGLGDGMSGGKFALCRCGGSKNKPFCDGTHWYNEFSDEKN